MANRLDPQLADLSLNGTPVFLGVIVATTTKSNHDTATPFNNTGEALKGKVLLIQTDTACYVNFGTTNAVTATGSATGGAVHLADKEKMKVIMNSNYGWIAAVAVSGTSNVQIWELKP